MIISSMLLFDTVSPSKRTHISRALQSIILRKYISLLSHAFPVIHEYILTDFSLFTATVYPTHSRILHAITHKQHTHGRTASNTTEICETFCLTDSRREGRRCFLLLKHKTCNLIYLILTTSL
jgi:hypothetical protein